VTSSLLILAAMNVLFPVGILSSYVRRQPRNANTGKKTEK